MSVAWFELHQELARHRKSKRLARILGINRPQAIGHMVCLWAWAMDHADDGDLSGFDAQDIAEEAQWTDDDPNEFLEALVESGFLDRKADTVTIHDWDEYTGRVLEQRRANRLRAKEARERARTVSEPNDQRTRTVREPYGATGQDITRHDKEPRPDVEGLCSLLADLIEANGVKRPTITETWRTEMRLLIDRDGYVPGIVEQVIRFVTSDDFERSNVLSVPKLRKRFDALKLKADRDKPREPAELDPSSWSPEAQAIYAESERLRQEKINGPA